MPYKQDPTYTAAFELAVKQETEKRITQLQEQFAQTMEDAIQQSLQNLNILQAQLEKKQAAVQKELDGAKKARLKIEKDAEKIMTAYLDEHKVALINFTQQELLRMLAYRHLQAGHTTQEVAYWLGVDMEFVEQINEIIRRKTDFYSNTPAALNIPQLRFSDEGRGGTIWYENGAIGFSLWWEFGAGNAIAIIDVPTEEQWEEYTQLTLSSRKVILAFIAQQVIERKTSGDCRFVIGANTITIYRMGSRG
ncbi:MAG TPA: hypothetical protein PK239_00240 [Chitinophagales bacterium]|nr:hypothetical protein [Chitinophagales bacterium]HRK25690.1 hypothetical protein [Chitinophagales bacterium]